MNLERLPFAKWEYHGPFVKYLAVCVCVHTPFHTDTWPVGPASFNSLPVFKVVPIALGTLSAVLNWSQPLGRSKSAFNVQIIH